MKKLAELTGDVIELMNEMTNAMIKESMSMNTFTSMSSDEFEMLQKCMELMEKTTDLAITQAKVMDDMNAKMDMLLKKLEEKA